MMIDLSEMAEEHQQVSKCANQIHTDWHSIDNPWIDDNVAEEVERLNLYQKMYNGED